MPKQRQVKRSSQIQRQFLDEKRRRVSLSFSSEEPVKDWAGEPNLVLLHTTAAADLKRAKAVGAVLFNHNADHIVGSIKRIWLDEKAHKGRAEIEFDETPEGDKALARVKSGSLRGVSLSARPTKIARVEERERYRSADGREWNGPLLVATRWQVVEVSLTAIPADAGIGIGRTTEATTMPLSAKVRKALIERGMDEGATDEEALDYLTRMNPPEDGDTQDPPPDDTTTTIDDTTDDTDPLDVARRVEMGKRATRDAVVQERSRVKELTKIQRQSGMHESDLTRWIADGVPVSAARSAALDFMTARHRPVGEGGTRVDFVLDSRRKLRDAMGAHLTRRAGQAMRRTADNWKYNEKLCLDIQPDLPTIEVARQLLIGAGETDARSMTRDQVAVRAMQHSTSDFPYLLENVAAKSLGVGYDEARTTWQAWCGTGTLTDFKSASRVAVGDTDSFELVSQLMPITESSMSEKRETRQLSTYAKRFGVSRQAIINDDLNEFSRIPQKLGASAARAVNASVYGQLTSPPTMTEDSTALFATTHTSGSNLGTAGAPAAGTLGEGMKLMRLQKGVGAVATLNMTPRFIINPVAHELTVQQLLAASYMPTAASTAIPKWMYTLTPVTEPLLDAASATTWFLAADPSEMDTVMVEFLNGNQTPSLVRIETAALGMEWAAYIDYSVKVFDHRGLFKNAGA